MLLVGIITDHKILEESLKANIERDPQIRTIVIGNGSTFFFQKKTTLIQVDVVVIFLFSLHNDTLSNIFKIIKLNTSVKIILYSDFDNDFVNREIIKSGIIGIINKSTSMDDLIIAIELAKKDENFLPDVDGKLILYDNKKNKFRSRDKFWLSEKQIRFIKLCSIPEYTYKSIANELGLSPKTIDRYRDNIFKKLSITSRTGLALYAVKNGISNLP